MNWLWLPDGRTIVQNVGEVKRSAFKGEELTVDEDKIYWNFETKEVNCNFYLLIYFYIGSYNSEISVE